MHPANRYSKTSSGLDLPAHSGVLNSGDKALSPDIPPKIPPKPPFIRRKLALSFSSKKNDYANCVGQSRHRGGEVAPDVERSLKPKLAPKHMNPSLPNLRKLFSDDFPTPYPSTNPFSPEYCSSPLNFDAPLAYRLGEEFFNSLFYPGERRFDNLKDKNEIELKSKKAVRVSFTLPPEGKDEKTSQNNDIALTRLPSLTTNMSLTDPLPSRPPASSTAVPNTSGQKTSAKKNQEAQDKYAALKDLDDIFRTSVVVQEGKVKYGHRALLLFIRMIKLIRC